MKNPRLLTILLITIVMLSIPLIAMQFTDEVKWNLLDFVVAGALLLSTGLVGDLVVRKVRQREYRLVLYLAILTAFVLIWTELAVGIFGTPFAGT